MTDKLWILVGFGIFFFISMMVVLFFTMQSANRERAQILSMPSDIVVAKFRAKYPGITYDEFMMVWQALLSFFELFRQARAKGVKVFYDMPSVMADELWHELILDTRNYMKICEHFGGYIHHIPQNIEFKTDYSNERISNEMIKTCKALLKNKKGSYHKLPLLFTLDEDVGLKGGYRYNPNMIYNQFKDFDSDGNFVGS